MNTRYRILFITIILLLGIGRPQSSSASSVGPAQEIQPGWGILNYAVPESPAFKILGVSPDNIMRPATTRDIGISIGNYYINNGSTIPQNLSVEISPGLFNPKLNLTEYQNNLTRLWYTSSYSIGTKVNQNGGYDIGVGIKLKFIDDADLRTNKSLISLLDSVSIIIRDKYAKAMNEEVLKIMKDKGIQLDSARTIANFDYNNKKEPIFSEINAIYLKPDDKIKKIDDFFQGIANSRDSIKAADWNAETWYLGVAALFSSKDSLIKDLKAPSKLGLWTTFGCPLGTMGQLLIGLNTGIADDSNGVLNVGNLNLGLRAYYGQNDTKGFIQAESNIIKSHLPFFQVGIGLETTFAGSIWIDLSLNIKKTGSQPFAFTPGINISYGTSERGK